jgi:hypothetical protein
MTRYSADCREMPSDSNCDVKMSGSEEHLVDAAAAHLSRTMGTPTRPSCATRCVR